MNAVEQAIAQALEAEPGNWELRLELLGKLGQRGAVDEAIGILQSAPEPPASENLLQRAIDWAAQSGRIDAALPVADHFITVHEESPVGHYLVAKINAKIGDLERARAHYEYAVSANPDLEDAALAAKLSDLGQTMPQAEAEAVVSPVEPQPQPLSPPTVAPLAPPSSGEEVPAPAPAASIQPSPLTPPPGAAVPPPVTHAAVAPGTQPGFAPPVREVPPVDDQLPEPSAAELEMMDTAARHLVLGGDVSAIHAASARKNTNQKLIAVTVAILAHVVILGLFTLVVMSLPQPTPPQIVTSASPVLDENIPQTQEIQKQVQRKPVQSAQSEMSVISVKGASAVSMPDIVTDQVSFDPLGTGDSFGASMVFDAGADGGMVSFFGSKSVSKRVVFAVDYSASMNGKKDALMRQELTKSLQALPGNIEYQIIFFHGPAWYHGQEVNTKGDPKDPISNYLVEHERDQVKWYMGYEDKERDRYKKGAQKKTALFHPETGAEKPEKLPKLPYLKSTRSNIRKSIKIVEETPLAFGTDWRWPLFMAINLEPDTIFFMTDGAGGIRGSGLDDILAYNRRKARAKINTICMMVPNAADNLFKLADETRGEFSLVLEDGSVVRDEELERVLGKKF